MKKTLFAFSLLLLSAVMHAKEKTVLSVLMKDSTNVCFYLSEKPTVTFVGDDVRIVSSTEEATIARTLVHHFEFLESMPTSIDPIEQTPDKAISNHVELSDDGISVSGLTTDGCIRLYSLRGQQLATAAANPDGSAHLSLQDLPAGIYLINYNQTTIKFLKR